MFEIKNVFVHKSIGRKDNRGFDLRIISIAVPKAVSSSGFANIILSEQYIVKNDDGTFSVKIEGDDFELNSNVVNGDGEIVKKRLKFSELIEYNKIHEKAAKKFFSEQTKHAKSHAYDEGKALTDEDIRFTVCSVKPDPGFTDQSHAMFSAHIAVPKDFSECGYVIFSARSDRYVMPGKNVHFRESKFIEFDENATYEMALNIHNNCIVKVMRDSKWEKIKLSVPELSELHKKAV